MENPGETKELVILVTWGDRVIALLNHDTYADMVLTDIAVGLQKLEAALREKRSQPA